MECVQLGLKGKRLREVTEMVCENIINDDLSNQVKDQMLPRHFFVSSTKPSLKLQQKGKLTVWVGDEGGKKIHWWKSLGVVASTVSVTCRSRSRIQEELNVTVLHVALVLQLS